MKNKYPEFQWVICDVVLPCFVGSFEPIACRGFVSPHDRIGINRRSFPAAVGMSMGLVNPNGLGLGSGGASGPKSDDQLASERLLP